MQRRSFILNMGMVLLAGCMTSGNEPDVHLEVSPDQASLPKQKFDLTLENKGGGTFTFQSDAVGLKKRVGNEVKHIRPLYRHLDDGPAITLEQNEVHTWAVVVDNESGLSSEDYAGSTLEVGGLGPGKYELGVGDASRGEEDQPQFVFDEEVSAVSFEITGDQPTLDSFNDAGRTSKEDNVVSVHIRSEEDSRTREFYLRRVEDEADSEIDTHLIFEQVTQVGVLRNTLPYFDEGVERVRLEAPESYSSRLEHARREYGFDRVFRYEENAYEIVVN